MRVGGKSLNKPLKFADHIRELQWRFLIVAVVFIAAAALSFTFKDVIVPIILSPAGDQQLIYLNPSGAFSFILLVSIYIGMAVSTPVVLHQIYGFIKPLLDKRVRKYSVRIILFAFALLIAGVAFGYFYAVPGALNFLGEFADSFIVSSLTADSYLDFMVKYTLGLGIAFQIPILLVIIHWIKPLSPTGLLKSERWVIVLAFIAAAIITPTPDPMNMTIVALPLIGVYQLGVITILISIAKEKRRKNNAAKLATNVTLVQPEIAESKELYLSAAETVKLEDAVILSKSPRNNPKPRRKNIDGIIVSRPHRRPQPVVGPTLSVQTREIASIAKPAMTRPQLSIDGVIRRPVGLNS